MPDTDQTFVDGLDQSMLFELIYASNFLDFPIMFDTLCKAVANMIKNKNVDQIRSTFGKFWFSSFVIQPSLLKRLLSPLSPLRHCERLQQLRGDETQRGELLDREAVAMVLTSQIQTWSAANVMRRLRIYLI